jgi:DNA-binding NarL/FixJ family response regulator
MNGQSMNAVHRQGPVHARPLPRDVGRRVVGESKPLRVLVVDDHPVMRIGMKAVIRTMKDEATVVGVACDGEQALDEYRALQPDVLTLDLRLPSVDGLVVLERLFEIDAGARVLVVTMYDSEEDVCRSFEAGALGYVLKSAPRGELVEAIRSVSRGEPHIPLELAQKLAARASTATLTTREAEVLELLRIGITNKEIAASLKISAGTVKTHVKGILTKLCAESRTEAVNIAIQRGVLR